MRPPAQVGGVEFLLEFTFGASDVTARNTCNGEITAMVQAPVRYLYTASVPAAGRTDAEDAGNTCSVEIAAGTFDFEIVGDMLVMTYGGETVEFAPAGSVAGLYGSWIADIAGVGTLTWSMGDGRIVATNDCDNGLSATAEVDADFVNKVEVSESAEDVVEDGFGLECSVAVAAGVSTYHFDGDTLVLTTNGGEVRFAPN